MPDKLNIISVTGEIIAYIRDTDMPIRIVSPSDSWAVRVSWRSDYFPPNNTNDTWSLQIYFESIGNPGKKQTYILPQEDPLTISIGHSSILDQINQDISVNAHSIPPGLYILSAVLEYEHPEDQTKSGVALLQGPQLMVYG